MKARYEGDKETMKERLDRLSQHGLPKRDAVKMLEECVAFHKDGTIAHKADYDVITALLEAVVGESLEPTNAPAEVQLALSEEVPAESVRLARGVDVLLGPSSNLVGLEVRPEKLAEGRRMMAFVGIGRDSATDVAERHDEYLIDAYLNAGKDGSD